MGGCVINIDNFRNYRSGDTIHGRVVCTFDSAKKFRGIRIKLRGKEHTSWIKSESYYNSATESSETRHVLYSGNKTFFENQMLVCGPAKTSPGVFEYPFRFILPINLPDTFKNNYGHIGYHLKAVVDIPWARDYEISHNVVVNTPIDFNSMINLPMNPVRFEDTSNICCCFCPGGHITMRLDMDKEAFAITERPRLRVHILNMSNESTDCLEVKIVMKIISKVTSPRSDSKTDKELIASAYDSGVGAHGDRTYYMELDIPPTTLLTNFNNCSLFEKRISLSVKAVVPGCHQDLEIKTRIFLGHIPLARTELAHQTIDRDPQPPSGSPPAYYGSNVISQSSGPFKIDNHNDPKISAGPSAPPAYDAPSAPSESDLAHKMCNSQDSLLPTYNDAVKSKGTKK